MPNVGGSGQRSRKLLATVVHNKLLYASPIWAGEMVFEHNVRTLEGLQRKIALRTVMAYRTVSTSAILVVAGMVPAHLLAMERQRIHNQKRQGVTVDDILERQITMGMWQEEWNILSKGRWTRRLIKYVRRWSDRNFGSSNYHVTQMLTGHGCFCFYLHRLGPQRTMRSTQYLCATDCGGNEESWRSPWTWR